MLNYLWSKLPQRYPSSPRLRNTWTPQKNVSSNSSTAPHLRKDIQINRKRRTTTVKVGSLETSD